MFYRLFFIVACAAFFADVLGVAQPGSRYPPTKGELWPKPQFQRKGDGYLVYTPSKFHFKVISNTCDMLTKAIERYAFTLRSYQNIARLGKESGKKKSESIVNTTNYVVEVRENIAELQIDLTAACEKLPYLGMDESYELNVDQTSVLKSNSIWGIFRGLESFSQLFYLNDDYTEVRLNKTIILDYPRYLHRGLLLDTSRHFISLNNILKTINAMSMNKMNVFHWHIVDDESFPYQSEKFPELSERGAFHPSMTYSKADIQNVIQYATERGIRVIPEFDVPGHTRSWGEAHPEVLAKCYKGNEVIGFGPMDPTKNETYSLLRNLFNEVQDLFPDNHFHVGGDEVLLDCWATNPELKKYMKEHNITTTAKLHALFMKNVLPLLKKNTKAIVWQEVFDEGVPLDKDVLVQVWWWSWVPEMVKILKSGHKLLFSSLWYLDHLKSGGDWSDFYAADPRALVYSLVDDSLLSNIIGGEACMWGEVVNDVNVISRVWPRTSAVAERLWSPAMIDQSVSAEELSSATFRLEEHTCRMNRRGVAAQPPNGPGLCVTRNNF